MTRRTRPACTSNAKQVWASERKRLATGAQRKLGGILPPEAVHALDTLLAAGALNKAQAINAALIAAARQCQPKQPEAKKFSHEFIRGRISTIR